MQDADQKATADREAVMGLYRTRGISPCCHNEGFFCAQHLEQCSTQAKRHGAEFHTGTWPYVGINYGKAPVSGHPVRVLFVAMERGGSHDPAHEPTFAHTQRNFRAATEERSNPHMGGTSQLMEWLVDDKTREVYSHQFALTNAVKCVEFTGDQNSRSTREMIDNCAGHLGAEISLLRPHLVITEGVHPKNTLLRLFPPMKRVAQFTGQAGTGEVFLASQFVILTTPHAARKSGWPWKKGPLPEFLQEAVARAAKEVLERNAWR